MQLQWLRNQPDENKCSPRSEQRQVITQREHLGIYISSHFSHFRFHSTISGTVSREHTNRADDEIQRSDMICQSLFDLLSGAHIMVCTKS